MNSPEEIRAFIKKSVAEQLPHVEHASLREWITARIVEPYPVRVPVDPDGIQVEDFWVVTDHREGKHYRIAFSPQSGSFGIVTPLASGADWYMGDYGTFKEAVDGM